MHLVLEEEERLPWLECVCQGGGERTGSQWGKEPGCGPVGGSWSLFGFYSSLSSRSICSAHLANEDAVASHCLSNFGTDLLCVLLPWLMQKFYKDEKGTILTFMGHVVQEAPPVAGEAQSHYKASTPAPRLMEPPFTCGSVRNLISIQPPSPTGHTS